MELARRSSTNNINAILLLDEYLPIVKSKYNVGWTIGRGHFGIVLLATSKSRLSREKYAVKMICKNRNKAEAESEVRYLRKLKGCKNIVSYHEHFQNGPHVAIVTNYFHGESFMHTFTKFTPKAVQIYMKNLLIALDQVHKYNITHCDVKPSNFLFNLKERKFLLVDFGIAAPVGTELDEIGTVGYMSPESIVHYEKSTTAIDMWATGVIFLNLLSGIYPFFQFKGADAFKEFAVVFGTKEVESFGRLLSRQDFIKSAIGDFDERQPLHLKKLAVLFRQYCKFYKETPIQENCRNCEQSKMLCICKKPAEENENLFDVLGQAPDDFPDSTYELLNSLLILDPSKRISASAALKHKFFSEYLTSVAPHCDLLPNQWTKGFLKTCAVRLKRNSKLSSVLSDDLVSSNVMSCSP